MGSIEPRTPSGPRVGTDSPTRSLIGDVVFNCGDDSRMQTRLADGQDGGPDRDTSQQLHAAIIDGTGTRGYRREAQELRLKGRSSGISFGGGHSLPMQHPAKAAGEGTEAAFVDAEGRPIPDRHSTAFAGANTATTFTVLWLVEKYAELHLEARWNGWFLLLLLSLSAYKGALWMHDHPAFVASMFGSS